MNINKEELAQYASMILEHQLFEEILEDLRTSLTNDILNTETSESSARENSYLVWKGADAFFTLLQSYKNVVVLEEQAKAIKEAEALNEQKFDESKADALRGL